MDKILPSYKTDLEKKLEQPLMQNTMVERQHIILRIGMRNMMISEIVIFIYAITIATANTSI